MNNNKTIIFTISKFSGEKFDCLITTPDIRATEDAQTQCLVVMYLELCMFFQKSTVKRVSQYYLNIIRDKLI